METDFWITCLQKNDAIRSVLNLKHIRSYLIGSSIQRKDVNDIDIALIYTPLAYSHSALIELRRILSKTILDELGIVADILLLSCEEAEEVDFFSKPAVEIKYTLSQ